MGTPAKPVEARRHFLLEIWEEKRELFKLLVGDALLALTVLFILLVLFLGSRILEKSGYASERIGMFETLHYWAYLIVLVMLLVDLIMKLFIALFLAKKP